MLDQLNKMKLNFVTQPLWKFILIKWNVLQAPSSQTIVILNKYNNSHKNNNRNNNFI